MAQKTIVELIDDLDGGRADESVSFGLDGVEYTIDLSTSNADALRKALEPFASAGQRQGGRKQSGSGNRAFGKATSRRQNQAIREWGRSQGEKISDRGRIPAELVSRFNEAHGA